MLCILTVGHIYCNPTFSFSTITVRKNKKWSFWVESCRIDVILFLFLYCKKQNAQFEGFSKFLGQTIQTCWYMWHFCKQKARKFKTIMLNQLLPTVLYYCLYNCLKLHQIADTRSFLLADTKELIIRNLCWEEKNEREPIQMYCPSQYKCRLYSESPIYIDIIAKTDKQCKIILQDAYC